MRTPQIFAFCVLISAALGASFAGYLQPTNTATLLTNATIFQIGLVGMAPHVSEEERALAAILAHDDAKQRLLDLLAHSTTDEGRMYALCGIRNISKPLFQQLVRKTKWAGNEINRMRADVVSRVSISSEVATIRRDGCNIQQPS